MSSPARERDHIHRHPDAVVGFYSRMAWVYEGWGRVADSRVRRQVRDLVGESPGGATLEVGCGSGAMLADLARDNPTGRTVGMDLALGMVKASRRRIARAGLLQADVALGDASGLVFEDESLDTVTSSYVLDILPTERIVASLQEFFRVLRPGGRVVVVNVTLGERRRHMLPELLYGTGLPLTGNCRGIRAEPLLRQVGFTEITRRYVSQLSLPSEILSARKR